VGTQDVVLRLDTTPPAVAVTGKPYLGTVVKPPAVRSSAAPAIQVVVLVRRAKPHPVAAPSRQARLGQLVSGVSAESRHAQSILVSIHLNNKSATVDRPRITALTLPARPLLRRHATLRDDTLELRFVVLLIKRICYVMLRSVDTCRTRVPARTTNIQPTATLRCLVPANKRHNPSEA